MHVACHFDLDIQMLGEFTDDPFLLLKKENI
jgi:hypothetical protein